VQVRLKEVEGAGDKDMEDVTEPERLDAGVKASVKSAKGKGKAKDKNREGARTKTKKGKGEVRNVEQSDGAIDVGGDASAVIIDEG
jgi:hypothetical protein